MLCFWKGQDDHRQMLCVSLQKANKLGNLPFDSDVALFGLTTAKNSNDSDPHPSTEQGLDKKKFACKLDLDALDLRLG